jgi:hypothetical protein
MSIIWADFPSGQLGIYGTNRANMLNGIWAEVSSQGSAYAALVADPDPNVGANGVVFFSNSSTASSAESYKGGRLAIPAEVTTLGLGFRWWLDKLPSNTGSFPFVSFRTNTNTDILTVRVTTTGQLQLATGASDSGHGGTTLATSIGPVLTANAYQHVEIKATKGAGTGAVEIRVNGIEIPSLTITGQAMGASNIAQIFVGSAEEAGGSDANMNSYIKDLVLWDTSGTEGNDFQGSVAVRDLYTDADISLNWTPSTGSTGWDLLDKTSVDDATYISAASSAISPYVASLTDLPDDVTSIRALLPIVRAVKTDGGDCNIQVGLTPNNTDWDDGADRPVTTASTFYWDVSQVSPDTLAPWTPVEVNSAYVRIDRTL